MGTFIRAGVLCAALLGAGFANADVTLESRNMPAHCEFVYQVVSEINIDWQPGGAGTFLKYELFHEYEAAWESMPVQPVDCSTESATRCRVSLAFESMSTAQHFLYRKIQFRFVNERDEALTGTFLSSFGREFGEPCFDAPDQTPFRSRTVLDSLR